MLTEERKKEIADEIVTAFKETGLKPEAGEYLHWAKGPDEVYAACAVGVIAYRNQRRKMDDRTVEATFIEHFAEAGADGSLLGGIIRGFDGEPPCVTDSADGYDIGRAVRAVVMSEDW